jgi:AcrR family transcriptional regulator
LADRAIVEAALLLLAEEGYERLTMEAVTARAGVGKATLYRRFQTKDDLVVAAVDHLARLVAAAAPAGAPRGRALEATAAATARFYAGPWGRALLGLVVEMGRTSRVAEVVRERFLEVRRQGLRDALRADVHSGALRADADVELAIDMVIGTVLYRALVEGRPLDGAAAARLAAALRDGFARPRAARARVE